MMLKFLRKLIDAIASRIGLVIFGLLIVIFGAISPVRCLYALETMKTNKKRTTVEDIICKDC